MTADDGFTRRAGLFVAPELANFIEAEALDGTGINSYVFWKGFSELIEQTMPTNRALLAERDRVQIAIDTWHIRRRGDAHDPGEYRRFLETIGYLVPEPPHVDVVTRNVDDEIAMLSGPQLVVPVTNARYVLNAVNARWGSLYDALYGTDALPGRASGDGYDADRGVQVVAATRDLLDELFPLADGSHSQASAYIVVDGELTAEFGDGRSTLRDPGHFAGYQGNPTAPASILLKLHGVHVEVVFDRASTVGSLDKAGVSDIQIEAALTVIVDFEDSVAAVDAEDKVAAYRTWLEVNRGSLSATFEKDGRLRTRTLADDRSYLSPGGEPMRLRGRALMFVRNVGHLMMTDAVRDADGAEVGEGIVDAVLTALCALLGRKPDNTKRNGVHGSIYIVKPKMHGPEEVRFTVELFARVEKLLGLDENTIKLGLMDEERRTSVNLKACIAEAAERLVFINTGFLDRSGDEIHTSMEAGPTVRKGDMKSQPWIAAYENQNVDIGLEVGLAGRGQIGKGMWAMPDRMADMIQQKIAHPQSGASTAWVPSPTAATLHALHYFRVDVRNRQSSIAGTRRSTLDQILTIPIGDPEDWDEDAIRQEVDSNVQSVLGYVVRWIDQGVGCSKVPDLHDVGLMEDRATLRISSQLLANWLQYGVVSEAQVRETLARIAGVVDVQNRWDSAYKPMTPDLTSNVAFQTAVDLIFGGRNQPNGYTDWTLHYGRRAAKAAMTGRAPRRSA